MATKQPLGSVIIVGGGASGTAVAAQLAKASPQKTPIKITVVDRQNYLDWSIASARMLVQPDSVNEFTMPLPKVYQHLSANDNPITFVHSGVSKISPKSVTLDNGSTLEADAIVIAIGGQYSTEGSLWKPLPDHTTKEIRMAAMRTQHEKVKASKSIVVAGAGPAGIEIAGEVKAEFPHIEVTMVGTLLPHATPRFRASVQKALTDMGVVIKEGRIDVSKPDENGNVTTREGEVITNVDMILHAIGFDFAGNKFADDTIKADVTEKGKFRCRPTLQLESTCDTIFCCGDIVAVPDNHYADIKGMMNAEATATIVANNIVLYLQKKPLKHHMKWSKTPVVKPIITVLSPKVGIADMGLPHFMENALARSLKCKDFFLGLKGKNYGKGKTF